MPPAARITDMHVCPIVIPFTPPHIGGPIITGKFNVIIGKMPAARVLDKLICKGPPDLVLKGSPTVIIGKLPAARMFDPTVHGGLIVTGFFPVIIGEFGMGSVIGPAAPVIAGMKVAAQKGLPVVPDVTPPTPPSYVPPGPVFIPPPMTRSGPGAAAGGGTGAPAEAPAAPAVPRPTLAPTPTPMNPVSEAEANELFRQFVAASDRIPFDYPADCCYSRAHEMCRMMQAQGIDCGKVWNYAPADGDLAVDTQNNPAGRVEWGYHVAPVINVRGSDGVVRTMVMDPAMFDHPVTVDQWRNAQHQPNSDLEFSDSTPYYTNPGGTLLTDPDGSEAAKQFEIHKDDRDSQPAPFVNELRRRRTERVNRAGGP
jgi:uncharacterized Zn-binding protein involved in type VI secretion